MREPAVDPNHQKYLRNRALCLAGDLPENERDAREVLAWMNRIVDQFFPENEIFPPPAKPKLVKTSD